MFGSQKIEKRSGYSGSGLIIPVFVGEWCCTLVKSNFERAHEILNEKTQLHSYSIIDVVLFCKGSNKMLFKV
jgi:hypothetical protein